MNRHIMKDQSLETFDEILNDGTFRKMTETVRETIESNPGLTVKELLKLIPEWGNDRNKIAPKITVLCQAGVVIRPSIRKCTITGKFAAVHELAPESWRQHRMNLIQQGHKGPYVKHRMEIACKTDPLKIHTTIWWTDGSVSCSCHQTYHRSLVLRCHHALGMIQAVTGKTPKEKELDAKLEELLTKYDKLLLDYKELLDKYEKFQEMF